MLLVGIGHRRGGVRLRPPRLTAEPPGSGGAIVASWATFLVEYRPARIRLGAAGPAVAVIRLPPSLPAGINSAGSDPHRR